MSEDLDGVETTDATRWLDDRERAAWLNLAGVLTRLPAALDTQLRRDAGLSHFEYVVLAMLSDAPDRVLLMSDLAALANGSLSRLSHVVSKLEKRGWVHRAPCESDGRLTYARLTDDGWAKVVAAAPGHVETVRSLVIDALSKSQLGQLEEIGEQVLKQLDPYGDRPAWVARSRK
jgi:DNA-binding MarR family transcriptional regulator